LKESNCSFKFVVVNLNILKPSKSLQILLIFKLSNLHHLIFFLIMPRPFLTFSKLQFYGRCGYYALKAHSMRL